MEDNFEESFIFAKICFGIVKAKKTTLKSWKTFETKRCAIRHLNVPNFAYFWDKKLSFGGKNGRKL